MSIRRKRRQRGKHKAARKKISAVQAAMWEKLTHVEQPDKYDSIIIPMIRRVMPTMIAKDLVSVQPMALPHDMFGNTTVGIEPIRGTYFENDTRETPQQRKAKRATKARQDRERESMEKIMRNLDTRD